MNALNLPIGTILMSSLSAESLPTNWLLCDGSAIPEEFQNLIDLIGQATPNLSGRVPLGTGKSTDKTSQKKYSLLETGGEEEHTLSYDEMPSHSHSFTARQGGHSGGDFSGEHYRYESESQYTDAAGGDQAHNNMMPYIALNFVIYAGNNSQNKD